MKTVYVLTEHWGWDCACDVLGVYSSLRAARRAADAHDEAEDKLVWDRVGPGDHRSGDAIDFLRIKLHKVDT